MLITERPHFGIPGGMPIRKRPTAADPSNTTTVDMVDMRLERLVLPARQFKWAAQRPDGLWLVYDYGLVTATAEIPPAGFPVLPDIWWEFAYGLLGDREVKAAVDHRERGERSQDELDAASVPATVESYERRLARLFRPAGRLDR